MNRSNLFVSKKNIWVIYLRFHFFGICDHISRCVASIKFHSFFVLNINCKTLTFFYGYHTITSNLIESLRNFRTNNIIPRRYCCNLCNFFFVFYWLRHLFKLCYNRSHSFFYTFLYYHWVCPLVYFFHTFLSHDLCKQSRSCCPVTCIIVCFTSCFFYKLGTHIFKRIWKVNLFCNRYSVVNNVWSTPFFIKSYIPTLRSQSRYHSFCNGIDTL